jgi:predicted ribosome quality control (RQC) complex YloA/Tae2 family protein
VKELKQLIDGRIQKIYQKEKLLRLEVYQSGKGVSELVFEPNKLFISEYKRKAPLTPDGFAMFLRKRIAGQRIRDIRQHNFERIIEVETDDYILIYEVFSKGNVILCNKDYIIQMPLEVQLWKDRQILPKRPYLYPPEARNPYSLTKEQFKVEMMKINKEIVKFLATDMSLSGLYAEEICARAGVDKHKVTSMLNDNEVLNIFETMHTLTKNFEPHMIFDGEEKVDVVPFDMKTYENKKKEGFESFTKALDEFFTEKSQIIEKSEQEKKMEAK